MTLTVDPPSRLPVDTLSLSSIRTYAQCPERWKRRYLDRQYEAPSGKMLLGSAAGAAEAQSYSQQLETGEQFSTEQVLDEFSHEWEDRIGREEVNWDDETPGELKDSGALALGSYHDLIAPTVAPVAVERRFELGWDGLDWLVIGFLDVEDADGQVRDLKMRGKRMSQRDADEDWQPTLYLAARRAEQAPAKGFLFDTMVRSRKPVAEVVSTSRTGRQLDLMTDRIFAIAREIDWRAQNDHWTGAAPGTWFCKTCRYTDCKWRLGA